jgi:DNA repair protein RadC
MSQTRVKHFRSVSRSWASQQIPSKFLRSDFACFNEHKTIELFLTLTIPTKDVKMIRKALLKTFGLMKGISDASIDDLMVIKGVGESTAGAVKIIRAANSLHLQEWLE